MTDEITYYAVIDELSSHEQPAGLFRRTRTEAGLRDEAFTRSLVWKSSTSLDSAERGDLENEFVEITEDEAGRLMAQLRVRWTS